MNFKFHMEYSLCLVATLMNEKIKNVDYNFSKMRNIHLLPWLHNVEDLKMKSNYYNNHILKKTGNLDYLIAEGPNDMEFHDLVNNFKGSQRQFLLSADKIMIKNKISMSRQSLRSLYDIINYYDEKPIFFGISKNIPASLDRELYLCSSTHMLLKMLYNNDCTESNIGILMGDSHIDSLQYYLKTKGIELAVPKQKIGELKSIKPNKNSYIIELSSTDIETLMKKELAILSKMI